MTPPPTFCISGIACLQQSQQPLTLVPIVASQSSSLSCVALPLISMAALL